MNYKNISIYMEYVLRVIYNILRILLRYPKKISLILDCLYVPIYVMIHFSKIKRGNLDFFNKTLK